MAAGKTGRRQSTELQEHHVATGVRDHWRVHRALASLVEKNKGFLACGVRVVIPGVDDAALLPQPRLRLQDLGPGHNYMGHNYITRRRFGFATAASELREKAARRGASWPFDAAWPTAEELRVRRWPTRLFGAELFRRARIFFSAREASVGAGWERATQDRAPPRRHRGP